MQFQPPKVLPNKAILYYITLNYEAQMYYSRDNPRPVSVSDRTLSQLTPFFIVTWTWTWTDYHIHLKTGRFIFNKS